MDIQTKHQMLLLQIAKQKEEKELQYINQPDPEPAKFWMFQWASAFFRG